jgi:hypothetical protein
VALVKMAPDLDPKTYDHKDEAQYGLGKVRKVEEFYRLMGLDVRKKVVVPELCKWVKSGAMHRAFAPALRPDGKGIDYDSGFEEFSAAKAVGDILATLRANAEAHIQAALAKNKPAALTAALDEAKRAKTVDPALMEKARAALAKLKGR